MRERIDLQAIFGTAKPLVGMVHLEPLPGAPRYGGSMRAVIDAALHDAHALAEAGADGLMIENFGDVPFHAGVVPPETVAALARCAAEVARAVALPFGINVLRNDAAAALGIAAATGAALIRVNVHTGAMLTDQGWIEGRAAETLRRRTALGTRTAILADVLVKHATPPPGLDAGQAARDCWQRGLADALIVTGSGTGETTSRTRIDAVRHAVPDAPLWIGSGIAAGNAAAMLAAADGAIIGSALKEGGAADGRVDVERARTIFRAARGA